MNAPATQQTIAPSDVPDAVRAVTSLLQVIDDLVSVRPVNWEDSRDPQQRAAWRAADETLVKFGMRRRGG